jgi:hypothetical protein
VSIFSKPAIDIAESGKSAKGLLMILLRKYHVPALAVLAGSALLAIAPIAAQVAWPTLTKPATAEKAPDADGFIQRWLILEPIGVNGLTDSAVQAMVKKEYFPNQFTVIPHDGDKVMLGNPNADVNATTDAFIAAEKKTAATPNDGDAKKTVGAPNITVRGTAGGAQLTWYAVDTKLYNVNLYHFAHALAKPTSNVLFWTVTLINCPQEMRGVRLAIGSNAASVWWVNGQEVIGIYGDRQTVIDDGVSKRLTLKKGQNILRAAVVNGGGATDFCARFLDENDKPVKGFTVSVGDVRK